MAGNGKHLRTAVEFSADGAVGLRRDAQQRCHAGVGLDVVDVRRHAEHAARRRERWLDARHPPFVVDGGDEAGLVAADVGAGAADDLRLEAHAGTERVRADDALLAALRQRAVHAFDRERIFIADVDPAVRCSGRVCADKQPLDQHVRVALHDDAIHPRTGVAFIGVAHEVLRFGLRVLEERPLHAGREERTGVAAEGRSLDHGNQLVAVELRRSEEVRVAAAGDVVIDVVRIDDAAVVHQPARLEFHPIEIREHRHAVRATGDDADRGIGGDAGSSSRCECSDGIGADVAVEDALAVGLADFDDRLSPGKSGVARMHDVECGARLGKPRQCRERLARTGGDR